jgi:hypothetical protein
MGGFCWGRRKLPRKDVQKNTEGRDYSMAARYFIGFTEGNPLPNTEGLEHSLAAWHVVGFAKGLRQLPRKPSEDSEGLLNSRSACYQFAEGLRQLPRESPLTNTEGLLHLCSVLSKLLRDRGNWRASSSNKFRAFSPRMMQFTAHPCLVNKGTLFMTTETGFEPMTFGLLGRCRLLDVWLVHDQSWLPM